MFHLNEIVFLLQLQSGRLWISFDNRGQEKSESEFSLYSKFILTCFPYWLLLTHQFRRKLVVVSFLLGSCVGAQPFGDICFSGNKKAVSHSLFHTKRSLSFLFLQPPFNYHYFKCYHFPCYLFVCLFVYWKIPSEGISDTFKVSQELLLFWINFSFLCVLTRKERGEAVTLNSWYRLLERKIHLNEILIYYNGLGIYFLRRKLQEHVHGWRPNPKSESWNIFFF